MLSYASAMSCMCDILVKFSAVAELQSFKGYSTGQKLNIDMGSFIVHHLTMNVDENLCWVFVNSK